MTAQVVLQGGSRDPGAGPPNPGGVVWARARQAAEQLTTMGLLAWADVQRATEVLAGYGTDMWQDGWTESRGTHLVRTAYVLPDADAAAAFVTFTAQRDPGGTVAYAVPAADPLTPLLDHADHCAGREVR